MSNYIDIYSEEEFYNKIIRKGRGHSVTTRRLLKKHGIKNVNDVLTCNDWGSIPSSTIASILKNLDKFGYRRADCNVEKYPIIDDYLRQHFPCVWCGDALDNKSNIDLILCNKCSQRYERVHAEKALSVYLSELEFDEDDIQPTGVVVNITIKNHTQTPLLISFDSLILQHNKMRIQSDYGSSYYNFDEDYIIPGEEFIIRKEFTTVKELSREDYFVVTFTDKTLQKQYIFKFAKMYKNDDYWEIDLNGEHAGESLAMAQAIKNMMKLEIPMEYIQNFRSNEVTYFIEGRSVTEINSTTYPKLNKYIECEKNQRKGTVIYGVLNEPSIYGEKTDKYIILCLDEVVAQDPSYQISQKGQIYTTVARGWCETTGLSEPTVSGFQVSDGGIWCLPFPITKMLNENIKHDVISKNHKEEVSPIINQEVAPKIQQEKRREFEDVLSKAIDELNLSMREIVALMRFGLYTVKDLTDYVNGDIFECYLNSDRKRCKEVAQKLLNYLGLEARCN